MLPKLCPNSLWPRDLTARLAICREELTRTKAEEPQIAAAIAALPPVSQDLARRYPPTTLYRMRAGAPYLVSHPGSIGIVVSYSDDGTVSYAVVFNAPGVTGFHGHDAFFHIGVRAHIDPQWLEPCSIEEAERLVNQTEGM